MIYLSLLVTALLLALSKCSNLSFLKSVDSSNENKFNLLQKLIQSYQRTNRSYHFSIFDEYVPIYLVENKCSTYYQALAQANAEFLKCVLNNARPFQMCRNCQKNFTQVSIARKQIIEVLKSNKKSGQSPLLASYFSI